MLAYLEGCYIPEPMSGCWLWTRGRANGYGMATLPQGVHDWAHRVAYVLLRGPIPRHLQVDHLCRTRACVNPWHMELVTPRENRRRGASPTAINGRKTLCPKGHPLAGLNLSTAHLRHGQRACLACTRERQRRAKGHNPWRPGGPGRPPRSI